MMTFATRQTNQTRKGIPLAAIETAIVKWLNGDDRQTPLLLTPDGLELGTEQSWSEADQLAIEELLNDLFDLNSSNFLLEQLAETASGERRLRRHRAYGVDIFARAVNRTQLIYYLVEVED